MQILLLWLTVKINLISLINKLMLLQLVTCAKLCCNLQPTNSDDDCYVIPFPLPLHGIHYWLLVKHSLHSTTTTTISATLSWLHSTILWVVWLLCLLSVTIAEAVWMMTVKFPIPCIRLLKRLMLIP